MNAIFRYIALVILLIQCSSCSKIISRLYGIKDPRSTDDYSVVRFIRSKNIVYDYLMRPDNDSALKVIYTSMHMAFNGIILYNKEGFEIANTNDTTCHNRLRSQITSILRQENYSSWHGLRNNALLANFSHCIDSGSQIRQGRNYILYFGVAKFIPIRKKLSDLDYLSELTALHLRDKVTVILVDGDPH